MKRPKTGIIRGRIALRWLLVFALPVAWNSYAGDITIDGNMNVASNLHVTGALTAANPATNTNEVVRKGEMDAAILSAVSTVSFTNLTDVPASLADGDDDFRWNGGTNGLDADAGRTSLGLGSAATNDAIAFAPTNLAAYAGNNLAYSNNQFHALPGYGDVQAVAAVTTAWPNLDTNNSDDTRWDGGTNELNAAVGRDSLGLGSAATNSTTDFAPADGAVNYQIMRDYVGWIMFSGSFNDLLDVPAGLADGDDDWRWNGGGDGLNAAEGRRSLELGTAATKNVGYFAPSNLAAYAGNNLAYSNNQFHALPGYGDVQAVAAVTAAWPNLDANGNDDTHWDGGAAGLNAAAGRDSLGLGSAATNDVTAFAPANLANYIMLPQGNLSMGAYTNMPPM